MQYESGNRGRARMGRAQRIAAGALLMLSAACADDPTTPAAPGAADGGTQGKYQVGYVMGADGRPETILFEDVLGDAVVDGDIVIGLAADVPRTPEAARNAGPAGSARLSLAVSQTAAYWPGGVVPYVIKANATAQTRANVLAAMARINRRIDGITFVEATDTSQPYVLFKDDNNTAGSCRANLGRDLSGPTDVYINGCGPGTTSHEILHALGFAHEQKRCDRDDYIDITTTLAADDSWEKRCTNSTYAGTTYDLLSVMHYDPQTGFNGPKVDLFLPFEGVDASRRIGQRDSLSSCDNRALDSIYPSTGTPVCDRAYTAYATYHTLAGYWGSARGIIVDDGEAAFTRSTSWPYDSGPEDPDYDGYHYFTTDDGKKGWYTFDVPADTAYNVYAWAFQKDGATPGTAVYRLYAGTPAQITGSSVPVATWEWNQSQGLRWLYLGTASLTAGTYTLQIQKKSGTTGTIVADAIRITRDDNDPVN